MGKREVNVIIFKCPECGYEVDIKGCRTCKHRHSNYLEYEDAKVCWDCDMFHKNYKEAV